MGAVSAARKDRANSARAPLSNEARLGPLPERFVGEVVALTGRNRRDGPALTLISTPLMWSRYLCYANGMTDLLCITQRAYTYVMYFSGTL